MPQAIARVKVEDYDRFIATFSTRGSEKRREHGCRGVRVFRVLGDRQQIVNVFDWDRSGIEAFMADPEVPEVMQAAGLQGPPEFTYVEQVEVLES